MVALKAANRCLLYPDVLLVMEICQAFQLCDALQLSFLNQLIIENFYEVIVDEAEGRFNYQLIGIQSG